jgi:hypothetical protein
MRFHLVLSIAIAATSLPASQLLAHGNALRVEVVSNRLVVSNGVTSIPGYVNQVFVEDDSDGDPLALNQFVQGFGISNIWDVPGFLIQGMAESSGLYLDVLARPVKDASPAKERVYWFWNPATELIQDAPDENHFQIRRTTNINRVLTGTQSVAPAPLKFAEPFVSDMNFHNHDLLRFVLHNETPAPAGVYGFFARLSSDVYAPSDPFLILVNNGYLEGSQMIEGALAINAAAVDASLPGDFNGDGTVDAADYTVWRDGLGSTYTQAHYTEWKTHFGQSAGSAASAAATTVPEPAGAVLVFGGILALFAHQSIRRSRHFVVRR